MKRGLVIGKFMPLHKGHVELIQFAAAQCDELIVSMTYREGDSIPGQTRFRWICEEFKNSPKIRPEISVDDFDDETLSWKRRIPRWISFLQKRFPQIDILFSSESYGEEVAEGIRASHIAFDPERRKVAISGSLIRKDPFTYWDFIAASATGYFVKKFCFFGPESTGKTTMAKKLASVYQTEFVPEVSREIVTSNDFSVEDIIRIGHAQTQRVLDKQKLARKLLFCDSDLITTQIYCQHYLKVIPPVLIDLEKKVTYDRYYLFDIDVPWVADEIRDLGERRGEMFTIFKRELEKRKILFQLVSGSYEEREKFLRSEIDKILFHS